MPSTVIFSFNYDIDSKALTVEFVSGKKYRYLEVPEAIYQAMKQSTAKGIYFNRHVKDRYEFEKVEE
jgi:hypothetical protein